MRFLVISLCLFQFITANANVSSKVDALKKNISTNLSERKEDLSIRKELANEKSSQEQIIQQAKADGMTTAQTTIAEAAVLAREGTLNDELMSVQSSLNHTAKTSYVSGSGTNSVQTSN